MSRLATTVALWLLMVAGLLLLSGCASKPTYKPITVKVPVPCEAAQEIPEPPARTLALDASRPGEVVKLYAANRAKWIGHADELRAKLEACK